MSQSKTVEKETDETQGTSFDIVAIIEKKKFKQELSDAEINWFINSYMSGAITDYQMSALLMAIRLNGMTDKETAALTDTLSNSGELLHINKELPIAVDKHSSGGVGDKTTLVVAPIVAAAGIPLSKMSGRGLGYSGGTLDKLESIPGFQIELTKEQFINQVKTVGVVVAGQAADLAPADGKLYALRDVTGTVDSLHLIASSIMSKKLAIGADGIVLDVKVGSGAFMETLEEAKALAQMMVNIGKAHGKQVTALLSDMNQPLGENVGNALEIREAIDTLNNKGPESFRTHCLTVAAHMLLLGKKEPTLSECYQLAEEKLKNGQAMSKFKAMIKAQNGEDSITDEPDKWLASAPFTGSVTASKQGYISQIDAKTVGKAIIHLGGGRAKKTDTIDHAVGVQVHKTVGSPCEAGETLITVHSNDEKTLTMVIKELEEGLRITSEKQNPLPLFYGVISTNPEAEQNL